MSNPTLDALDEELRREEIRKTRAEAELAEYKLDTTRAMETRTYEFWTPIMEETVETAIEILGAWERKDGYAPVTLSLHSGGGGVIAGLALYDFMQDYATRIPVRCEVRGIAASMAAVLVQAFPYRVAREHSYLMLHKASTFTSGGRSVSLDQLRDQVEQLEHLQERVETIIVDRSNISLEFLHEQTTKKDWWMTAEEALEHGLIDRLLAPGEDI